MSRPELDALLQTYLHTGAPTASEPKIALSEEGAVQLAEDATRELRTRPTRRFKRPRGRTS